MSRIAQAFEQLRTEKRCALIPYVVTGQPDIATTPAIASALIGTGANLIELGVPFSDPLADGPVIQRATHEALLKGVTPRDALAAARQIRERHPGTPLVFMGYYNPILRFGLVEYTRSCALAGVDGLIVPDLPLEESGDLRKACRMVGLDLIPLIAPTSGDQRIAALTREASGFVYCVSVVGITGARRDISGEVESLVSRIHAQTTLPIAIGFGISTAEHVRQVCRLADGAVVGSALVEAIASAPPGEAATRAAEFFRGLR